MANKLPSVPTNNTKQMKVLINSQVLMDRVQKMLGASAGTFLSSVLDLYTSDGYLNKCDPNAVMAEAMKAASLSLPITKALGFAYIVPYGNVPTFIIGYRGLIQLAMRTGKYKTINAGCVYEGERMVENRITGEIKIEGEPTSDKAIGYFAYMELTNGFSKMVGWTREKVVSFAKKKSRSYNVANSAWQTDFDSMAQKTVLRQLLSKYGIMSVEYVDALAHDEDERIEAQIVDVANAEPLTLPDDTAAAAPATVDAANDNAEPDVEEEDEMPAEANF